MFRRRLAGSSGALSLPTTTKGVGSASDTESRMVQPKSDELFRDNSKCAPRRIRDVPGLSKDASERWESVSLPDRKRGAFAHLGLLLGIMSAGCVAPMHGGSATLPLDSDLSGVVRALDSCGASESGSIGTWPISRKEAARMVLEASERPERLFGAIEDGRLRAQGALYREITGDLPRKAVERLRLTVMDSDPAFQSFNDFGWENREGRSFRLQSRAIVNIGQVAVVTLAPELVTGENVSEGDDVEFRFNEANVRLFAGSWEFLYGTDSMWWGPGVHGASLVSNNALPFERLFKISTHEPVLCPVFGWPTYFTLFWTKLEKDRTDFPEPYLGGMRLEFRVRPWFTLGMSRTAMFGGEGRGPVDLGDVWDVFWAKDENLPDSPGDQRAGLDMTFRLPSELQPVQLYMEIHGEDEAGGVPTRCAYLVGAHLPRLGRISTMDARVEWASNHVEGHPDIWYNHGIYTDGYTYEDRIIGHHMGSDADDLFFSLGWRPRPTLALSLFFDRERRHLSDPVVETKNELGLELKWTVNEKQEFGVSYVGQEYDNYEQVAGNSETASRLQAWLTWSF